MIINDGCDGCSYLVGLDAGTTTTPPQVFLARIEQGGLVPEYYAVLEAASCDVFVGVPSGPGCLPTGAPTVPPTAGPSSKHDFGTSPLQLRFQVGDVARARAGINASRRVT